MRIYLTDLLCAGGMIAVVVMMAGQNAALLRKAPPSQPAEHCEPLRGAARVAASGLKPVGCGGGYGLHGGQDH